MTTIAPEHRVVLIRIPKSAPLDGDPDALYEATRQWWRVGVIRTDGGAAAPTHALAVVKGTVVAAYAITSWEQRPSDERWAFHGGAARDAVARYVGADVSGYFPLGSANPLRYVHCDPTLDSSERLRELQAALAEPRMPRHELEGRLLALSETIRAEPLAHVMFGHRELFHSNLLGWFVEALPEAADRVFAPLLAPGETTQRRVDRERDHLDLAVHLPGRQVLAIENKVFAVYDHQQLDRNAEAVAAWKDVPGPARLVLLSMLSPHGDPAWSEGTYQSPHGTWHHLSYDELGRRIDESLSGAAPTYEVETMRRYARLVRSLSELVQLTSVMSLSETLELPFDLAALLGDRRLAASLLKLRTRHVAQLVETALARAGRTGAVHAGFSNGRPLLDWFVDLHDGDGTLVSAGWQLQGQEFRRCLVLDHLAGRTEAQRQRRFAYAAQHPEWFDFRVTDHLLTTAEVPSAPVPGLDGTQGFKRYDPDFVYRSKKVSELTVLGIIDVARAVADSLS